MTVPVEPIALGLPVVASVARPAATMPGSPPRVGFFNDPRRLGRTLLLPVQITSLLVLIGPLVFALYMSFTGWSPTSGSLSQATWVGFDNYDELFFDDDRFIPAVLRTLALSAICLALEFALGLGLAVLFMRKFPGKRLFFSLLLTPMMILPVVVGYTFWMLFQANGPVNQLIAFATASPVRIDWLSDATLAFVAIVVTEVWHWTPLFFLVLLSGLNAVPENPVRAAVVLGASPAQVFWRVVFPMLKPVIVVAFVIRGMEVIKLFDEVFMLTRGGPGSATETISMYIYKLAFADFRLAYAAAAAFVVLLVTLVAIYLMLSTIRDHLVRRAG